MFCDRPYFARSPGRDRNSQRSLENYNMRLIRGAVIALGVAMVTGQGLRGNESSFPEEMTMNHSMLEDARVEMEIKCMHDVHVDRVMRINRFLTASKIYQGRRELDDDDDDDDDHEELFAAENCSLLKKKACGLYPGICVYVKKTGCQPVPKSDDEEDTNDSNNNDGNANTGTDEERVRPECAYGCEKAMLGDGQCHPQCNIPNCNFDYGDCVDVTQVGASNLGLLLDKQIGDAMNHFYTPKSTPIQIVLGLPDFFYKTWMVYDQGLIRIELKQTLATALQVDPNKIDLLGISNSPSDESVYGIPRERVIISASLVSELSPKQVHEKLENVFTTGLFETMGSGAGIIFAPFQ